MATVIQGNGLKPLTNGSLAHLEMDSGVSLNNHNQLGKVELGNNAQGNNVVYVQQSVVLPHANNENTIVCVGEANRYANEIGHSLEQNKELRKEAEEPEVDIVINNVVCSFSVRCHLNLRQIALTGCNVEYRRENGVSPVYILLECILM
jgi:hypothetical protein